MNITRREALKIAAGGAVAAFIPGLSSLQLDPATEATLIQESRSWAELWGYLCRAFGHDCIGTTSYAEAMTRVYSEVRDLPNHPEAVRMYAKAITHGVTTFVMGGCSAQYNGRIHARPPELTLRQAERIFRFTNAGLCSKLAAPRPPLLPSAILHEGKAEVKLLSELKAVEDAIKETKRAQAGAIQEGQLSRYRRCLELISTRQRILQGLSTDRSLANLLDHCYKIGYHARNQEPRQPCRWTKASPGSCFNPCLSYWEQAGVLVEHEKAGVPIVRYRVSPEEAETYARDHDYDLRNVAIRYARQLTKGKIGDLIEWTSQKG